MNCLENKTSNNNLCHMLPCLKKKMHLDLKRTENSARPHWKWLYFSGIACQMYLIIKVQLKECSYTR